MLIRVNRLDRYLYYARRTAEDLRSKRGLTV